MNEPDSKHTAFPTYVISLVRATDRRAALATRMAKVKLPYELIDATDEREGLSPDELKLIGGEANLPKYKSNLVPGALGCLISHLRCYEKLLASDSAYALILEDDVEFAEDFIPVVNEILSMVHNKGMFKNWHLINLGGFPGFGLRPFIGKDTYPLNILSRRLIKPQGTPASATKRHIGRNISSLYGTHCYLISRAGCRFALDNYPNMFSPLDWAINHCGLPKSFMVACPIAYQHPYPTAIEHINTTVNNEVVAAGKEFYMHDMSSRVEEKIAMLMTIEQETILRKVRRFIKRSLATLGIIILLKPASYYKQYYINLRNYFFPRRRG